MSAILNHLATVDASFAASVLLQSKDAIPMINYITPTQEPLVSNGDFVNAYCHRDDYPTPRSDTPKIDIIIPIVALEVSNTIITRSVEDESLKFTNENTIVDSFSYGAMSENDLYTETTPSISDTLSPEHYQATKLDVADSTEHGNLYDPAHRIDVVNRSTSSPDIASSVAESVPVVPIVSIHPLPVGPFQFARLASIAITSDDNAGSYCTSDNSIYTAQTLEDCDSPAQVDLESIPAAVELATCGDQNSDKKMAKESEHVPFSVVPRVTLIDSTIRMGWFSIML